MTRSAILAEASPPTETPRWSSSEPVHCCLRGRERTEALIAAIDRVVRPGDTVVDAGAGAGILSLAAASAGAGRVYAVELDPFLVGWLRTTVEANGLADRIAVVPGNALIVDLPPHVDVVVAELIDTGLIDELQVPVLNAFHDRAVIGPRTRLVPHGYATSLELVEVDDVFYGHRVLAPIHDWPNFRQPGSGWLPLRVRPLTPRREIVSVDFGRPVEPRVERDVVLMTSGDGLVNGLRLTGVARLAPGLSLGATNAINCDTILPLAESRAVRAGDRLAGRIGYEMGGGLVSVAWRWRG